MTPASKWVWMPHTGHLCVGMDCRFHLNTRVGRYVVSTVGEYLPDSSSWHIYAQGKGVTLSGLGDDLRADFLKKVGYIEVGFKRTYETMVFRAKKVKDSCCPWQMDEPTELDMEGYSQAGEAYAGHLRMCAKWSRR